MKTRNYSLASSARTTARLFSRWNSSIAKLQNVVVAAALIGLAGSVSAAQKNWAGPNPGTATAPVSGLWDTNSTYWTTGTGVGDAAFTHNSDGAIFGGADGSYFIQCTNLSATNIVFNASGYVLTNDIPSVITINGNTRGITVASGKTATIGTNVTLSGTGNPFLFNTGATAGGTLIIENGGIVQQQNNQPFNFDGANGSTIRVMTGGSLLHTGNGSNIRLGLTTNASPEIRLEGGNFICTSGGGTSFGSVIMAAANNSTSTITVVSGVFSNAFTANAANGSLNLGNGIGSLGTFNLNGGTLAVGNIRKTGASATGVLNLNGGTLKIASASSASTFFPNGNATTVNVRNGGATIDASAINATIGQPFAHSTISGDNATDGGLTITGQGTITMTATNTYTGATVVTNGTLSLGASGSINSSSLIAVQTGGTLNLSNQMFLNASGGFTLSDGTVQLNINNFPTNIVTGTFTTEGSANVINVASIVGSGSIPQATPLIKYTSLGAGVVDGNNNLTTLSVVLPGAFGGYLTNNTIKKTIDLVLTSGTLKPQITADPVSITRYKGATAQFSVSALGADGYFWRSNGVSLNDGGNVSGSKTNVLTISNVSVSAVYDVVLTNSSGSVTSASASLTVITPTGYAGTNVFFSPVSYYRFSETDNSQPAYDFAGGKDGAYLANVVHVAGPVPNDGYANFELDNAAIQCAAPFVDAHVVVSNSWNINTNTVTLLGWIYPVGNQNSFAGIIHNRGSGVVCGLTYSGSTDAGGNRTLGYTWNNEGGTWDWNSGLVPPQYQWSMVALVVTATNATIYVANTNGIASAVHTYPHPAQSFAGPISIGSDSFDLGGRSFTGYIDEVAAFDHSLTQSNILALLTAASGLTDFPPVITTQPVASTNVYAHQTAQLSVQASGLGALTYQWMRGSGGEYTNVPAGLTVDGSALIGPTSSSLVISNISLADAADYIVVVANANSQSVTSMVSVVTVTQPEPPTTFTTSVIQSSGNNWDTDGTWSQAGSATALAAQYYGSTFVILAPGGLRTPDLGNPNSPTSVSFPGEVLRVEGNGSFDTSLNNAGAIRIKGGNPATVYFKKLIMAGGQISSILNSGWSAILTGEVNVISNSVIWASDDTSPRSITIQGLLTGDGTVQYHGYISTGTFRTDTSASLNIANANNSYTGTWNVELGTVVGSAANALGTNTITVGAQGALQTTYNINNPNADLILNGRMNLTQNDTFKRVYINSTQLSPGTYSYMQLTNSFPANFPATWTGVNGALTSTNVSGSITVLEGPAASANPGTIVLNNTGGTLQLTWTNSSTLLLSATNILGPWTTNAGATSPFTITNNAPQKFFRLQSQ